MSYFNKQFKDNVRLSQNPLLISSEVRTTFDRSHTNKTTFTSGQLIPVYFDEVLPGDTHIIDFKYLIRMSTPIVPTLDNSVIDFHFFFCPTRIIWNKFKNFMGENPSAWIQNTTFETPKLRYSGGGDNKPAAYWFGYYYDSLLNKAGRFANNYRYGYKDWDLAAYLGLPINRNFISTHSADYTITPLPFFAYAQIWNDWYRDQNVQDEILIPKDTGDNRNYIIDVLNYGGSSGAPETIPSSTTATGNPQNCLDPFNPGQAILAGFGTLPVSKLPDYFTTCLPSPQKGNPVTLSIASMQLNGQAEVINRQLLQTRGTGTGFQTIDASRFSDLAGRKKHIYQMLTPTIRETYGNNHAQKVIPLINTDGATANWSGFEVASNTFSGGALIGYKPSNTTWNNPLVSQSANMNDTNGLFYHDMVADLTTATATNINTGISINDLRLAFATQQFLELDARGGTRYIEILRNHFGVISPDARLQRSEYIGGRREYTNISQVLASNSTNITEGSNSYNQRLGTTGAYSLTVGESDNSIVFSATEHGYIMGFVIVRPLHTYAQGIEKVWTRFTKFDYYWPEFANIGEQPVYQREIYVADRADSAEDGTRFNAVFGYNEAWAEYRYKPNRASGWFSPNSPNYLSAWTYTDNYNNAPVINGQFMRENRGNIQQTLWNLDYDQFLIDLYFNVQSTRPLPAFSVPGLTRM